MKLLRRLQNMLTLPLLATKYQRNLPLSLSSRSRVTKKGSILFLHLKVRSEGALGTNVQFDRVWSFHRFPTFRRLFFLESTLRKHEKGVVTGEVAWISLSLRSLGRYTRWRPFLYLGNLSGLSRPLYSAFSGQLLQSIRFGLDYDLCSFLGCYLNIERDYYGKVLFLNVNSDHTVHKIKKVKYFLQLHSKLNQLEQIR